MRCLVCKSDRMEESTNTYFAQLENCYVIIENVLGLGVDIVATRNVK